MRKPSANTLTILFGILFVVVLGLLLFGAYCTFTTKKWALYDYGVYTNMIWNCGRGDWFRCLVDRSYLATHLSFSLALIGPLFYVWDSPLLLMVVQWVAFCGGCACVAVACRHYRLPPVLTTAALLFFALWPFTQSVLLSSFHGTAMYLLLLPWLYVACAVRSRWTGLPLVLLLGLREDAFLFAFPVVLYFAIRDRWLTGYIYAGLALLYGLMAIFVLFPWINEISLFDRRSGHVGGHALRALFSTEGVRARAWGLLWVVLPMLLLVRRGLGRALALAAVPVVATMASGSPHQYELRNHYPAVVMAGMMIGLVEAVGSQQRRHGNVGWGGERLFAILLVALTLVAHAAAGFLYFGRQYHERVGRPHGTGRMILRAVAHLPKEGLLVVPHHLGGACANRAEILSWRHYDPEQHQIDVAFSRVDHFHSYLGDELFGLLDSGNFGVTYFDDRYVILQRGAPTDRNDELRRAVRRAARSISLVKTFKHAGANRSDRTGSRGVRHWDPDHDHGPQVVAFGKSMTLAPGAYEAALSFRARPPRNPQTSWGRFELYRHGGEEPLADAPIEPAPHENVRTQRLAFAIAESMRVEPRIVGEAAELWLHDVEFIPSTTVDRD